MARRQRNIYKRKDGRYEALFIKSRDLNGKATHGSVYAKTYAEAKVKLEKVKLSMDSKTAKDARKSIVKVLENYLDSHKIMVKPSTYWVYHGYIKNHIRSYFLVL